MAYRLTYSFTLSWVGAGSGPMTGRDGILPAGGGAGAQSLGGISAIGGQVVAGAGTGGVLNGTDVTTLTNAMAADVAAQMNKTAFINQVGGWTTGGV